MGRALDPYKFRATPTFTGPEAAARAGIDYEDARRIWRSLGLPEVAPDVVNFDDADVEALQAVSRIGERGIPFDDLVRATRAYGRALSAVADAEARIFSRNVVEPLLAEGADAGDIEDRLAPLVEWLLAVSGRLLDHAHRRHLGIAIQSLTLGGTDHATEEIAVAFVDMSGFSRASDELGAEELGQLVERFETVAIERAAEAGVRVVKVIGDAVMLVSSEPRQLVRAVQEIIEEAERDEGVLSARAGADFGNATPLLGDYFGRPVNVAARITGFARPGTVVGSEDLLRAVGDGDVVVSRIGSQKLKGVGRVHLFKFHPPADDLQAV